MIATLARFIPRTAPAAVIGSGSFGDTPELGWTPTLVTTRNMSAISQSGWGIQGSSNLALATDASAPVSPNTVIRETTPESFVSGSSAAGQEFNPINATAPARILHAHAFLYETGWNWHPTSTQKMVFSTINGANSFYTCAWGSVASAVYFGVGLQGLFSWQGSTDPDDLSVNLNTGGPAAAQITENVWKIYWTEITGNTAGQENARVRQWVDSGAGPVLTLDQTGFAFTSAAAKVDAINISTMRGGNGPVNPSACSLLHDSFILWRDAA